MTIAEDTVVVKNIYYMMAYAFRAIDIAEYRKLGVEPFDNMLDLLAAILLAGLSAQRRRGFERNYETVDTDMLSVRGRIDIPRTMRLKTACRHGVHCIYDERTENTLMNRVLKTTAYYLLKSSEVRPERRKGLKTAVSTLHDIDLIIPEYITWSSFVYHKNNRSYQLLMNVCYMVLHDLLLQDEDGEIKLANIMHGESLHRLYEKFILEYYRKHHPELNPSAREIHHMNASEMPSFLPRMYTDVTLSKGADCLIIDAKCYGTILNTHFDKEILSPSNVNQIFSYVLHASQEFKGHVSGMLLYARTEGAAVDQEHWFDMGHDFYCDALDLNQDFSGISNRLEHIAGLL